jgi:hypothetical protein
LSEKIRANVSGKTSAVERHTGRVKRESDIEIEETFDMDAGDGNARVTNTRGFKKWASDHNHGLTVESTVTVSLACNQDRKTIRLATKMAGALAETYARKGITEMNQYFDAE